ncbi:uncharacterized protein LOC141910263 [Tubulanus polymorphus]|uniref:uncharacterized protein LOC141910263 n=1 Tax=Tubulanus polymorphus TaxID=672921 RepID=UPI003DA48A16
MVLFMEGVGLHVREDELKLCLRRHLDWLDEIVVTVDDNTWFRWSSRRQTVKSQGGLADDDCMVVAMPHQQNSPKRRLDMNRKQAVAQNVLRAVKRRRGGGTAPAMMSSIPPQNRAAQMNFGGRGGAVGPRPLHQPYANRSPGGMQQQTTPQKMTPRKSPSSTPQKMAMSPVTGQQQHGMSMPSPQHQQQHQQMMSPKHRPQLSFSNNMSSPNHSSSSSPNAAAANIPSSIPSVSPAAEDGEHRVSGAHGVGDAGGVVRPSAEMFTTEEIESTLLSIKNSEQDVKPEQQQRRTDDGTVAPPVDGSYESYIPTGGGGDDSRETTDVSAPLQNTEIFEPKPEYHHDSSATAADNYADDGEEDIDDPIEIIKVEPGMMAGYENQLMGHHHHHHGAPGQPMPGPSSHSTDDAGWNEGSATEDAKPPAPPVADVDNDIEIVEDESTPPNFGDRLFINYGITGHEIKNVQSSPAKPSTDDWAVDDDRKTPADAKIFRTPDPSPSKAMARSPRTPGGIARSPHRLTPGRAARTPVKPPVINRSSYHNNNVATTPQKYRPPSSGVKVEGSSSGVKVEGSLGVKVEGSASSRIYNTRGRTTSGGNQKVDYAYDYGDVIDGDDDDGDPVPIAVDDDEDDEDYKEELPDIDVKYDVYADGAVAQQQQQLVYGVKASSSPARDPRLRYACQFCDKAFMVQSSLTRHLRTHPGIAPFSCRFCTKCFRNTSGLEVHMNRMHKDMLQV